MSDDPFFDLAVTTEPYTGGKFTCSRCSEPATVVQWWYRGNSNDRIGPVETLRCEKHKKK